LPLELFDESVFEGNRDTPAASSKKAIGLTLRPNYIGRAEEYSIPSLDRIQPRPELFFHQQRRIKGRFGSVRRLASEAGMPPAIGFL